MSYVKLVPILLLSLVCTTNVLATGLHNPTDAKKEVRLQAQGVPAISDPKVADQTQKIVLQSKGMSIDQVVVTVNNDAITRFELEDRLAAVERQLKKQGTALPAMEMLKKQLLERMITEMLQAQLAKETGVRVDDVQLDKALQGIAKENKFSSIEEFRTKVEKEGVDFKKFREEIRGEIVATRLREREVDSLSLIHI